MVIDEFVDTHYMTHTTPLDSPPLVLRKIGIFGTKIRLGGIEIEIEIPPHAMGRRGAGVCGWEREGGGRENSLDTARTLTTLSEIDEWTL